MHRKLKVVQYSLLHNFSLWLTSLESFQSAGTDCANIFLFLFLGTYLNASSSSLCNSDQWRGLPASPCLKSKVPHVLNDPFMGRKFLSNASRFYIQTTWIFTLTYFIDMHRKLSRLVQCLLLYTFSFASRPWKIIKVLVLIVPIHVFIFGNLRTYLNASSSSLCNLNDQWRGLPACSIEHLLEKVTQNLILLCKTFLPILSFTRTKSCSKNRFQNLTASAQCVHAVWVDQPHLERPRITRGNDGFSRHE